MPRVQVLHVRSLLFLRGKYLILMKYILHSEYRTLEYLLWRIANSNSPDNPFFLDNTTNQLATKTFESKSRNLCSIILIDNVECFFLKQPTSSELGSNSTIINEKNFYDWIEDKGFTNVPKFVDFDSYNAILTTEMVKKSTSLTATLKDNRTIIKDSDKWKKSATIIEELAKLLATFHQITAYPPPTLFSERMPAFLPILDNPNVSDFSPLSITNINYLNIEVKTFQRLFTEYAKKIIIETNRLWQFQTVIHFDFRTDNILLNNINEIVIADWEMCSLGDPVWDIATIFNCLPLVISNKPTLNNGLHYKEQLLNLITIFWNTYKKCSCDSISVEKLKTFWKCIQLRHYLEFNENFDGIIDELTKDLV